MRNFVKKSTSRFFETICIRDGKAHHLAWHNHRLNATRRHHFGCTDTMDLEEHLKTAGLDTITRCRVVYNHSIVEVSYHPYRKRQVQIFKPIHSSMEYPWKGENRDTLNQLFAAKEKADEIIICRNGFVRDTTIANIALKIDNRWLTPDTPLLPGTCRARLLAENKITEAPVTVEQLHKASALALMNAMIGFDEIRGFSLIGESYSV